MERFLTKLPLVIIASIAAWQVQKAAKQNGDAWESSGAILAEGLRLAIDIWVLWTVIVLMGGLIAYLGRGCSPIRGTQTYQV